VTPRQALVIAEARKWLGTPYVHAAELRGVGVDCLRLLVHAFVDSGVCPACEVPAYSADWHLHRAAETYLDGIGRYCDEAPVADPQPADILLFRWGRTYSHGALVTRVAPSLTVLHAYQPSRRVVEHALVNAPILLEARRAPKLFRFRW